MEVKPFAQAPVYTPAPAPVYAPPPAPVMPIAPMMEPPHHDHIHLHAAYKHTAIFIPEMKPVAHLHHHPVVAPFTSTASILVLFILLVIITRSFWGS